MNILITGGTGFIGTALTEALQKKNNNVSILTRNKKQVSTDTITVFESIDEVPCDTVFDVIINLAGAPISKRWTQSYQKTLINSRLNVTHALYDLVKKLKTKPKRLISASAIGYYGRQGHQAIDENGIAHDEFTHQLCDRWEAAANRLKSLGMDVVIIRLGVVLGLDGGILKETAPMFKLGLGGTLGTGKQYLSWVHITDVVHAIQFLIDTEHTADTYNLTAPYPVTNAQWTKVLSKTLKKPACLPLPSILVRFLFGAMGEALLLNGQRVVPKKLQAAGFHFKYPKLEAALRDIFTPSNPNRMG